MTEKDKEVQELRRKVEQLSLENARLKADNSSLETMHQLDQSELIWYRRMMESMVEKCEAHHG